MFYQEGSDHEEGEDADGEEEDFDIVGDETSDDSDSEELEEKGRIKCNRLFHVIKNEEGSKGAFVRQKTSRPTWPTSPARSPSSRS